MPFIIIRNDITKVEADAVVNTANPHARIGAGTDAAIYQAAGEQALLAERKKIGDIAPGKAAATAAFGLPAKYVIHTVGPVWIDGKHAEAEVLRSCYAESLGLAKALRCESIAFPLISTGTYGFPKDLAIKIATSVIFDFLMENEMTVCLVVFDRRAYDLSGKLFHDVRAYIDENYVAGRSEAEYPGFPDDEQGAERREMRRRRQLRAEEPFATASAFQAPLEAVLSDTDITFQECLLKLIVERDLKNSEVYHGANISKQHFSKIISNREYHPTKNTACALALAFHLNLNEANALLEKAGLVLSKSSRFDLAVEYFIIHKMYNIVSDNIILDENGLDPLGTQ